MSCVARGVSVWWHVGDSLPGMMQGSALARLDSFHSCQRALAALHGRRFQPGYVCAASALDDSAVVFYLGLMHQC